MIKAIDIKATISPHKYGDGGVIDSMGSDLGVFAHRWACEFAMFIYVFEAAHIKRALVIINDTYDSYYVAKNFYNGL